MLDHIELAVADIARARAFYDHALAAIGVDVVMSFGSGPRMSLGDCSEGHPYFWVVQGPPLTGKLHVAFTAEDRASVDAFYAAAMAAGGRDNGPPGPRPQYHPDDDGAFVLDPDGHNVEAVCHTPA